MLLSRGLSKYLHGSIKRLYKRAQVMETLRSSSCSTGMSAQESVSGLHMAVRAFLGMICRASSPAREVVSFMALCSLVVFLSR